MAEFVGVIAELLLGKDFRTRRPNRLRRETIVAPDFSPGTVRQKLTEPRQWFHTARVDTRVGPLPGSGRALVVFPRLKVRGYDCCVPAGTNGVRNL